MKSNKRRFLIPVILTLVLLLGTTLTVSLVKAAEGEGDESKLTVTKDIEWTPGSDTANVVITSNVPNTNDTQVLFLGTLCGAHGMKGSKEGEVNTITESLNAIAQNADITYYLLNAGEDGSSSTTGTLSRGSKLTSDPKISGGGNHNSLEGFLNVLYKELVTNGNGFDSKKDTKFDYIVLEFDGSRLAASFTKSYDATKLNTIADELKKYYDAKKVIWITDGREYKSGQGSPIYTQTDGYYPTTEYMTESDSKINYLSAKRFRALCALVAPDYYKAHTDESSETYYGNGTSIRLTSYGLTTITRKLDGTIDPASYNDARQLTYNDAEDLADFLYMVIPGISMHFNDRIVFSDDVEVTDVEVYITESLTNDASTVWTERCKFNVTAAVQEGLKTDTATNTKYVTNSDAKTTETTIKVTAGNTGSDAEIAKNNQIEVTADDVKNRVKFIKVIVKLKSATEKFDDCIELVVDKDGNPVLNKDDNLQFVMNPNDGPVVAQAYSGSDGIEGKAVAEGTNVANAPVVNLRKVKSQVTGGTKAQEGGIFKQATDEALNPYTVYSADYKTVSTSYTPTPGNIFKTITIDGTAYDPDNFKTEKKLSGTGYTVELKDDGSLEVVFANLTADHEVAAVFENGLSIAKGIVGKTATTTTADVTAGDEVLYSITITNASGSAVSGLKITDTLDTNLTFKEASDSGAVSSGVVTWTGLNVAANSTKTVTFKATVNPFLTEKTEIKNLAVLKSSDDKEITKSPETKLNAEPKAITVKYAFVGTTKPYGVSAPSDDETTYGSAYNAKTQTAAAGWIFSGWYKEEAITNKYADGTALTKDNFADLATKDEITLYGQWTYGLSMTKTVDKTTAKGGETLTYTITVANASATAVTGYTIADVLDENLEYSSSSTTSTTSTIAFDKDSRKVSGTNLTVPANGSITFTIEATISKKLTTVTVIENTATGKEGSNPSDPNPPAIEPPEKPQTTVNPRDLVISYHYVGTVPAGATVHANVTTKKYGETYTAETTGSSTTLTNPTWFEFSGWYLEEALTTAYDATKALTEENHESLKTGNEVKLYGAWTPKDSFTVTKGVTYGTPAASVKDKFVNAGSTVTYTVEVANDNPETAAKVSFEDKVPAGLTVVSGSISNSGVLDNGVITWSDITLAAGGSVTVSFNATVPSDITAITEYENLAYVTEKDDEPYDKKGSEKKEPGTVKFKGMPMVTVIVATDWSDTWDSHENDTVKVHLYKGTESIEDIDLTKTTQTTSRTLPAFNEDGTPITYSFKEYLPGTPETVLAEGDKNGDYKVSYEVTGNRTDIHHVYQFKASDFTFTKTGDAQADGNGNFVYEIKVKNNRTYETAKNIVITDEVPSGLTVVSAVDTVTDNTVTNSSNVYTWTVKTLAPGATATLTITVKVPEGTAAESYTNIAKITKIDEDPQETPKETPPVITTVREFTVVKEWYEDGQKIAGTGKAAVTVQLKQNGVAYGTAVELSNDNDWTYTWKKLPLLDDQSVPYSYTVVETAVEGYTDTTEYDNAKASTTYGDTKAVIKNTIIVYQAIYHYVGTDIPDTAVVPTTDNVNYGTNYTSKTQDTIEGYIFDGWYTEDTCENKYVDGTKLTSSVVTNNALNLYGKWTKKVKVEYEAKGDVPAGFKIPDDLKLTPGTKLTNDTVSNVESYIFRGWFVDPECTVPYVEGTPINQDTKLYGLWERQIPPTGDVNPMIWLLLAGASFGVLFVTRRKWMKAVK